MRFSTLISCEELAAHLDDSGWRIVDCRHRLYAGSRSEVCADPDRPVERGFFPPRGVSGNVDRFTHHSDERAHHAS